MTRKQALIELRDKVEAGERPKQDGVCYKLFGDAWVHIYDIYSSGSLDAAKALHEAVLSGWSATIQLEGLCYVHGFDGEHSATSDNPARAWLLAILEALISQEKKE